MTTTTSGAGTPAITRAVGGIALPVAGSWAIDPAHADVAFIGRHFMLTKVRGRFTGVTGVVEIAPDPNDSRVDVSIDMQSVNSGDAGRDEHLRSAEMFDVANHPTATLRSTRVAWSGTHGTLDCELTIRGVTRAVLLEVAYEGSARDPWGGSRSIFSASTQINREDFGLTWNVVLGTGGLLVSKDIKIEIDVETVLQVDHHVQ
jgi:polyisoprenoid-binding protein YceI